MISVFKIPFGEMCFLQNYNLKHKIHLLKYLREPHYEITQYAFKVDKKETCVDNFRIPGQ